MLDEMLDWKLQKQSLTSSQNVLLGSWRRDFEKRGREEASRDENDISDFIWCSIQNMVGLGMKYVRMPRCKRRCYIAERRTGQVKRAEKNTARR